MLMNKVTYNRKDADNPDSLYYIERLIKNPIDHVKEKISQQSLDLRKSLQEKIDYITKGISKAPSQLEETPL